ncbi:RNA ligase (ATP) [Deinococcus sp.]|uniref:RNA ligase (ATP) n=1 Tax=Deinococcus sp. TaxID=47478 RepID=UPI003C7E60F6
MEWTVSKQVIEVRTHPNADALDILKVGQSQLVARKGVYQAGDTVLFIAEKSVLPAGPLMDEFGAYLVGPDRNRVSNLRLRGEYSCGVTWPLNELDRFGPEVAAQIAQAATGENVAALLGISKYEPPIPQQLAGQAEALSGTPHFVNHDVLHLAAYLPEFAEGEPVMVTEKLHGTQVNVYVTPTEVSVTSKGVGARGLRLREEAGNTYWQAVRAAKLVELARAAFPGQHVQLFGEVVPVQKGYSYGFHSPHVRLFDVRVAGQSVPYATVGADLQHLWVPVLHVGPLDLGQLQRLAKGQEAVSGVGLHIREGVVVRPLDVGHTAQDGSGMQLKVINPNYKDSGEELS